MIIYFSATGNCKYIASQAASNTDDYITSIVKLTNENDYTITLDENESLGIVMPTYFWGLPAIVEEYFNYVNIQSSDKNHYIYIIASYGTAPGYSAGYIKDYLKDLGYNANATYSIIAPDTWTVKFNLSNKDKVQKTLLKTQEQLDDIIIKIQNKKEGNFVRRGLPKFISNFAQVIYDKKRATKHLHVSDDCIGCGLCMSDCPMSAIKIEDNLPVWKSEYCLMCLRCLHRCPVFAISYDNKTQKHGQYLNPNIDIFD